VASRITALKLAILEAGVTQKHIADATGISESRLSFIVRGLHADDDTKQAIAGVLGERVADLFPEPAAEGRAA
jgi:transcriptional regulator with XRE-family HTH domain